MASSSRVIADAEVCIGAGNCVSLAPAVFDQDEEGTVVVRQAEVTGKQEALAADAAENCPAFAITLERIGGSPAG
jgi:ferredoxin